ncbi:acyl-CoA dehydrogenase family protein [Mycolicibacterium grossiae]|uniref:Acyl-CoA dehydrogenase n=1 Tax=Mycolicibacterium grossiae TaxID=1552759 RepID=A0A1E8QBJ7_9MYCO|nr:acyl-CoA dehydrogenase family protein [Mycolicibacterium grossiae]OFJ55735.1 acyl-CoA dehydrogenase [Mycolicibacterium grossiae]QEM43427.1 acyl-CoA dehydrogenase [Mycolicibacterium grossiae]
MSADLVRRWLADGALDLPVPGGGDTAVRWSRLESLTEIDVAAGRLAEAHADAAAILVELSGRGCGAGELWGVWAAEAPDAVLAATDGPDGVRLDGAKAWCSGATVCTHALVTARLADGRRGTYAVDLSSDGVEAMAPTWQHVGMSASDTRTVRFTDVAATAVGAPQAYLTRPGFWHGAIGVAACWLGGARAVARRLYVAVADDDARASTDPHAHAHLGAVDAALAAGRAVLDASARTIDDDPHGPGAELLARRVRAVVEHAVDEAIVRTGRALGPAPLALDRTHAQRVADLTLYVRQSHAERDLAVLGLLAAR